MKQLRDKSKILKWLMIALFISCNNPSKQEKKLNVKVTNNLAFARNEVVAINVSDLQEFPLDRPEKSLRIRKKGSTENLRTQWIDNDQNGTFDQWLFQAEVAAGSSAGYTVVIDSTTAEPENDIVAYSRFVPERADDYTWENDRVAFRTYGPAGQKEALAGVPGSTLSSGIDLWLKRTDKSIINKWYAEHIKNPGYYHIDHGEGYDPYHVGRSRGTGGSGIWVNDSLYVSENYTKHRMLANGPLRTVFELDYGAWSPYKVTEKKRITLDLGSNFSKFEIALSAEDSIPNYTVGITLHENEGKYEINKEKGWFRHWETIDSSEVGQAIILTPSVIDSVFAKKSEVADQSNLLILTNAQKQLTYYAGFVWEKSGQISNMEEWKRMLEHKAEVIENPLEVRLE